MVSVLLPFRFQTPKRSGEGVNAAATLDVAIHSIAHQTLRDWELLLIENTGSSPVRAGTDESASTALDWSSRDPRIRVIQEPAIGIAHALNTGLRHAKGLLIARMDADDIAHPDRLAKQVIHMKAHPEIGVLGTRTSFATTVEKSSGMQWFVNWQNAIITPQENFVKRFVDAPLAHPTVMFRKELVDRFGGYDTGPLPEDHELWLRWMHHGVHFAKLPEELLTWNDHRDRLSRTHPNYSVNAFFTTKAKWIAAW